MRALVLASALWLRQEARTLPVGEAALVGAAGYWGYATGGADWGEGVCHLANANLGPAARQSPIDFGQTAPADLGSEFFIFTYPDLADPFTLYGTGSAFAVTLPETYKGGFVNAPGMAFEASEVYRMRQMTLHAPGEHLFAGVPGRVEVQFMHERGLDRAAVAVAFVEGQDHSAFLAVLLEHLPTGPHQEAVLHNPTGWPIQELLKDAAMNRYDGSLTVPPCDQNIRWYVRSSPISATASQLDALEAALRKLSPPGNARAVQPANGREVSQIAARNVHSEWAVDAVSKVLAADDDATGPKEEEPAIAADEVANNPAFSSIFADDTQVIIDAKQRLKQAEIEANAASGNAVQAKQALETQEELYRNCQGLVEKMDMTWNMIFHRQNYAGAKTARENAIAHYNQVLSDVLGVLSDEVQAQIGSGDPGKTAESFSDATKALLKYRADLESGALTITTAPPGVAPTVLPDHEMVYAPQVVPISGEAANPFSPVVAESTSRIRVGGQPQAYDKLNANLRQPEGPGSSVPPPVLRKQWYDPEPPSTNATNVTGAATVAPAVSSTSNATGNATAALTVGSDKRGAVRPSSGHPPQAWWSAR